MRIIYIQDQEIYRCDGRIYHPKSRNYFTRYLSGLAENEKLTVICCIVDRNKEETKRYQEVSNKNIVYESIPDFRKVSSYFTTRRIIKEKVSNSDFCYIRTGLSGIIAAYYCKKYHVPYMFIVNEDIENNLKTHKKMIVNKSANIIGNLMRHYISSADYACYVTKEYLQKRYPCNGKSLGCSDIEALSIEEKTLNNYINKDRSQGNYIIGTVGPVNTKLKGQDVVITAIKILKDKGINITYQLVGYGSGDWLITLAKELGVYENIQFLGEISRDDVLLWMRTLDLYIQPSKSEGLPRAIIEAMSCALPCIAADVGGISELIPKEYLFEHDNNPVERIVEIIEKLDNDAFVSMSNRNFQKVKEYDPRVLDKKRSEFFKDSISSVRREKGVRS